MPTPVYLFVPLLPVENINGVYCVRYPLSERLFYWSLETDGKDAIPEKDWEKYGVPELETETMIGSKQDAQFYTLAQGYLYAKRYDLDGMQYARDHGFPKLICDDPHNVWFQAESFSLVELFGEDKPDSTVLTNGQLNPRSEGPNEWLSEDDPAAETCSDPLIRDKLKKATPVDVRIETNDSEPTEVVDLIVSNTRSESGTHSESLIADGAVNTTNISIEQGISYISTRSSISLL
ncbi:hypothetical protein PQX77_009358 [Marasmius sp. AFHP31]|nr:hypothetical protein PQX77_009358 [Marasmius sp. AFHP31]